LTLPSLSEDDLTLGTLPPLDTVRWLPKRKAALVRALQAGLLTIDEACVHPMRFIEASDGRAIPRGIGFSIEVAPTSIGVVDSGAEGADNAKEQRYLTGRRGVLTHFPAIPAGLRHEV